jgi:hypothetical protein
MVVLVRAVEMEMAGLSAQSRFFAPDFIAGTIYSWQSATPKTAQ